MAHQSPISTAQLAENSLSIPTFDPSPVLPERLEGGLARFMKIVRAAIAAGLAERRQYRPDDGDDEPEPERHDPALVAAPIVDAAQRLLEAAARARDARRGMDAEIAWRLRDDAARLVYVAMNVVERPDEASACVNHERDRELIRDPAKVRALLGLGIVAQARGEHGAEFLLADGSLLLEAHDPAGDRCWALEAWRPPRLSERNVVRGRLVHPDYESDSDSRASS